MKKTYILITLLLAVVLTMLLSASAFAYDYGDVMTKAISWYDANRCGTGVATNNVFSSWRGNCHTSDSVNGGFHDAGDHVKFQLPAAFSASAIGWSIYEFKAAWPSAALTKAWQELKLFCDYSMACWNGSSMVIQIGDGGADHGYWGPPENQTGSRPTSTAAAADIVGQTAASLAIMSINYKSVDSAYATTCLNTAKAMFNAVKNSSTRGTAANGFYTSSSHADDLAWASIWLSIATGDQSYLANTDAWMDIKNDPGDPAYQKPWTYCWDDSALGNMIMMYKLTGGQKYYDGIMWNLNWYSTTLTKTPAGLPYLNQWAVLRYDSAEAGLMYIMAKEFGVG
ncbi:MAG TPA: glycoside hydrolase family 9 protein, partial [Bacillota bacterium]|nr:glycoside hydrolase family 9 protein [Bacillota bacterium]